MKRKKVEQKEIRNRKRTEEKNKDNATTTSSNSNKPRIWVKQWSILKCDWRISHWIKSQIFYEVAPDGIVIFRWWWKEASFNRNAWNSHTYGFTQRASLKSIYRILSNVLFWTSIFGWNDAKISPSFWISFGLPNPCYKMDGFYHWIFSTGKWKWCSNLSKHCAQNSLFAKGYLLNTAASHKSSEMFWFCYVHKHWRHCDCVHCTVYNIRELVWCRKPNTVQQITEKVFKTERITRRRKKVAKT